MLQVKKNNAQKEWKNKKRNIYIVVALIIAVGISIAIFYFPILYITGNSMASTINKNEVILIKKTKKVENKDIVAFYYNKKIFVKRVIAKEKDIVDLDTQGNVYINKKKIEEPYIKNQSKGDCNITFPYQVPEGKVFLLNDNRIDCYDSRNSSIGSISNKQIIGKLMFRF